METIRAFLESTGIWKFLEGIETSTFPTWINEGFILDTFDVYYVLLAFHSLGMAIVVGICFIISARLLGYGQAFPLADAARLLPLGWYGFALNLSSGLLLFIAKARRELVTIVYDLKMLMIVAACVTMVMLGRVIRSIEVVPQADGTYVESVPAQARLLAVTCSLFWLMAVGAGRMIAFMHPPPF
ncbi:MAG: hypothetical protein U1E56_04865 [Bauldia sp.]